MTTTPTLIPRTGVVSFGDAGKYTRAELKPYLGDKLETDQYKAVLVAA